MRHLVFGIFWLVVAAALFGWQALYPETRGLAVRGTNLSAGWIALVFGLYKLARWWSVRSAKWRREVEEEFRARRQSNRENVPTEPTLDFTEDHGRPDVRL